jgi:hypothetical protein
LSFPLLSHPPVLILLRIAQTGERDEKVSSINAHIGYSMSYLLFL